MTPTQITECTDEKQLCEWLPIQPAPKDGTEIVGVYQDGECQIFWSDRPVCMLGSVNGGFPPGWATCGVETDYNLPMDEPLFWKPLAALNGEEYE